MRASEFLTPKFKYKVFEDIREYHRFLMNPKGGIERLHNCRRHPLKQYATLLEDNTSTKEMQEFSSAVSKLDQRQNVDINVGSKISILYAMAMPDKKNIDIYGFTNPKTIKRIFYEEDGSIEYILFDNGDTYPESGELVNIGGINVATTIMFPDKQSAETALTKLWFTISRFEGLGWKAKTSLTENLGTPYPGTYEQEYSKVKRKGSRRRFAMTYEDQELDEALDSPYPYQKVQDEPANMTYKFTTKDNKLYGVYTDVWKNVPEPGQTEIVIGFSLDDAENTYTRNYKIQNTGDARRVFSTVVAIVKEIADRRKPNVLKFSASKSEPSRVRLYNTMIQRLDRVLPDYTMTSGEDDEYDVHYELVRNPLKSRYYNP